MQIKLNVSEHLLTLAGTSMLAGGSENVDTIKVTFDSTWNGFGKLAVFNTEKTDSTNVAIDTDGIATIPSLKSKKYLRIGIVGIKNEQTYTTNVIKVYVEDGAVKSESEAPADDVYHQILSMFGEMTTTLSNIIDDSAPASTRTYSSNKIEKLTTNLNRASLIAEGKTTYGGGFRLYSMGSLLIVENIAGTLSTSPIEATLFTYSDKYPAVASDQTQKVGAGISITLTANRELKYSFSSGHVESGMELFFADSVAEDTQINELANKVSAIQSDFIDARIGYDGTSYDTLGTAIRTQVNNLKEDLDTLAENDFIAILNRKLDVIKGKFEKGSIDENGQNVFSNDLIRSIDYIKIYPGIPYQFKTINGNGLVIRIYKSDGSIRSEYMGATTTERTRTITFNSDDEKIRVVINAYKDDYTTYPVSADNFESIIANVSEYIAKDYNYGSIYNGTINIDTVNKIVSTSGVSILTNYGVYITVPAGEINIDYEAAVYIGVNKYDSEHNLIVRTLDSSMASDFIRIFVYHKGKVWFADKINGIAINGKNYNENVKTICCIGDSFTASNISWHTFIGQNLGYNMVNLGVSGTRMTVTYTGGGKNYECFIDRVANGALNSYSPDLIVLFGGINDTVKLHNNQMHIGTIDDEAEYSASTTSGYSFISRVKYLINLIKEKKPSAQILGVIPPNYSEGTSGYEWWSEYIAQIQEALRKVYEYYGIPYVDLKKRCQEMYENEYNLSTYRINGRSNMHPSKNGYKAIAKCIQKDGIENMFVN